MGSSKKQTVGYWYHLLAHFKLTQGPIDAFLVWRGGDRNAWEGELTSSGEITINARNLWGGEEKEGGIEGTADILFGEEDQEPNAYLLANLGEKLSAERGIASAIFKGGRYGAFNPYPKDSAFKFRRILMGWEGDACWYPEKAEIPFFGEDSGRRIQAIAENGATAPSGSAWDHDDAAAPGSYGLAAGGKYVCWDVNNLWENTDGTGWNLINSTLGGLGGQRDGIYWKGSIIIGNGYLGYLRSSDGGATFVEDASASLNVMAASDDLLMGLTIYVSTLRMATSPTGPWTLGADHGLYSGFGCYIGFGDEQFMFGSAINVGSDYTPTLYSTTDGMPGSLVLQDIPFVSGAEHIIGVKWGNGRWVALLDNWRIIYKIGDDWFLSAFTGVYGVALTDEMLHFVQDRFYIATGSGTWEGVDGENWELSDVGPGAGFIVAGPVFDNRTFASLGMNPAHILYDSHTYRHMDGYPTATINNASLTAAADLLYDEGFGLCARYDPNTTSVEEFQQRICDTIGGNFSLDDATGEYHLDLLRPDFDIETLPILTDDDVLEFSEEPSILDDAVNSIVVEWFDPETKETRITEPLESLGAIQAFGVNTSTAQYPDIPTAELAARVGQRDVNSSTTPTRKLDLKLNRVPYALRKGTRVRLQLLKRGIADMVCVIVEADKGTLKSGAISMKLVQDIFSLPSTTYVVSEPGEDTGPTRVPVPIVLQAALEVPYVELAGRLTTADLNALAPDSGFIAVMAADPASTRNYSLYTQPAGGEYADQGVGDWCPTAIVVEASGFDDVAFTLASPVGLSRVALGTAALWGDEIVRVDTLDVDAGTVEFGRGCGDTVPVEHAAGERVWFYDADAYADDAEYVGGETVQAKLLTNTVSQRLNIELAAVLTVEMDERHARPYPPAQVRINGEVSPPNVSGEVTATWVHRDRLLQADQLVDHEAATIGPEADTTYTVRWYMDSVLEQTDTGVTGTTASYTPTTDGLLRIEIESERDGLASWQMHVRETTVGIPLETEDGDALTTESLETIFVE